jgi:proteasome lid subunit RPN8/RPN11
MIDLAQTQAPSEACGAIWCNGRNEAIGLKALRNQHETPTEGFAICPITVSLLTFLHSWVALWHSHPNSRAVPSREDVDLMRRTDLPMVIVSLQGQVPDLRAYALDQAGRPFQLFRALQTDRSMLGREMLTDRSVRK